MKKIILFGFFSAVTVYTARAQETPKSKTSDSVELSGINLVQNYRLMYLNAYNFDFGNTSVASNYVGHLNIFSPSLNRRNVDSPGLVSNKRFGWGFNTGILKIDYNQKDSSNRFQNFRENVYLSPFDQLRDSLKYLKQINTYKAESRSTVWSFYVQPTFELTKAGNRQHIYLHGHLELLSAKWSSKTSIVNLSQDTGMFSKLTDTSFIIRSRLNNEVSTSSSLIAGYFGAGVTFDLQPWKRGGFFFQYTAGMTSNTPSPSSTDISNSLRFSGTKYEGAGNGAKAWNSFYLVRAYYTHSISDSATSKGTTIVVGMDIRGFFPVYNPQYAAYIGLNVGLDSVLDLIKGNSGK